MANCCSCPPSPLGPTCRIAITTADLDELIYVSGLNDALCPKYETPQALVCRVLDALPVGTYTPEVTQVVTPDCTVVTIPATNIVGVDTPCFDITVTEGPVDNFTISGAPIISPNPTNAISCQPGGLYAPDICQALLNLDTGAPTAPGTLLLGADCQLHPFAETPQAPLLVTDSECIDLTITPGIPQTLTADLIISPDPDNVATCSLTGLFVPSICEQFLTIPLFGPATPGVTQLVGKDCLAYTIPPFIETPITVVDTPCINLTASGTLNHTIQADLVVSGAPGNALQCTPLGAYVPTADVNIEVVDTPCLNLTVTEAPVGTFTISGVPTVSPAPGNQLSCTAQGLFVAATPPADINVIAADTDCFDMSVVEGPVGTFTVFGSPIINGDPANILSCTGTGLFVPQTNIQPIDTPCINMSVTPIGDSFFQISAVPTLADAHPSYPAGCNGLACTPSGLSAPPDHDGATGSVGAGFAIPPGNQFVTGDVFTTLPVTLNIVNPSDCRSALLQIFIRIPGIETSNILPYDPLTASDLTAPDSVSHHVETMEVRHSANLPGVLVIPDTNFTQWSVNSNNNARTTELDGTNNVGGTPPAHRLVVNAIVPPGFVGTYTTRGILSIWGNPSTFIEVSLGSIGADYFIHTI